MKKFTGLIKRTADSLKTFFSNEYVRYTLAFYGMMLIIYLVSMFARMFSTPGFTYAEF